MWKTATVTFFKTSLTWLCNNMKLSKWWQIFIYLFIFCWNIFSINYQKRSNISPVLNLIHWKCLSLFLSKKWVNNCKYLKKWLPSIYMKSVSFPSKVAEVADEDHKAYGSLLWGGVSKSFWMLEWSCLYVDHLMKVCNKTLLFSCKSIALI